MSPELTRPVEIFVSYSHDDEHWMAGRRASSRTNLVEGIERAITELAVAPATKGLTEQALDENVP